MNLRVREDVIDEPERNGDNIKKASVTSSGEKSLAG